MKREVVIKWINKFSGETGYVKKVSVKGRHFVNTFDKTEAVSYPNDGLATVAINKLHSFGEGVNNNFVIVDK